MGTNALALALEKLEGEFNSGGPAREASLESKPNSARERMEKRISREPSLRRVMAPRWGAWGSRSQWPYLWNVKLDPTAHGTQRPGKAVHN